jgi:ABC-type uncharacterized transport system substrate-binding protein
MPPPLRASLVFPLLAALGGVSAAAAATPEGGVCIATSQADHATAAAAAQRALGVDAQRIDVREAGQRAALSTRCGRLVIAFGNEALRAAAERAPDVPRVYALAHGAGLGVSPEADPRRTLETLRELAPGARRVGAVYDPGRTAALVAGARAAAAGLGVELVLLPVSSVGEAIRAFHRFERELDVDALWLLPDATATVQETVYYALELAHWRRIAVIGLSPWYVAGGALFALVPRPESAGRAAGALGALVLRGEAPPGEVRADDEALYLNVRAATRLGLTIPSRLLDRAEQVLP